MISQMLMQRKTTLQYPVTVVTAFFLLTFFIATVPLARVANYDHTPRQAMMGSFLGISWAFLCILLGTVLVSCGRFAKKYGETLDLPCCKKAILCDIVPCNVWIYRDHDKCCKPKFNKIDDFEKDQEDADDKTTKGLFDEDDEYESDTYA